MNSIDKLVNWLRDPVKAVFLLSIVLSCIAIYGVVAIGKDAALYMDIAKDINMYGVKSGFERFNWPWISILIAYTHKLTGVGYETAAYIYSTLFMAGVSTLTVLIVHRKNAQAAWWAVLLVLSIPVFNEFRYEIIRETGSWFFLMLSIYLVYSKSVPSWLTGGLFQISAVLAMLFRFEAIFIVLAVGVYYFFDYKNIGLKNVFLSLLKSTWIYLLGVALFFAFLFTINPLQQSRIENQLSLLNPISLYSTFMETSGRFADVALLKWSYSDAPKMLFVGILFVLLYRTVIYMGVVSAVLLSRNARREAVAQFAQFRLNTIAAVIYFVILFVFFVQLKFINSRYMALLIILLVPIMSVVASEFFNKHKRQAKIFIVISALVAISNVVSLSDKKTHYLQAAQWLKQNTSEHASIYYEDSRIQYYSGRGYGSYKIKEIEKMTNLEKEVYQYLVVEYNKDTTESYFKSIGYDVLEKFSSKKKTVFILIPSDIE